MSLSVASYLTCPPRAAFASAISASSPTEGAPPCCPGASRLCHATPPKNESEPSTATTLQVDRWSSSNDSQPHATPTPFSTAPGHRWMKSLAHTPLLSAQRASGFLLTAFSNATPHTLFQP